MLAANKKISNAQNILREPIIVDSILRFEEYLLKEGCYGNLFRHSELSQRG